MAIREEDGRTFSERTADEVRELLRADIESLTSDERKALHLLLDEMASGTAARPQSLFQLMREADYVQTPVDMETFIRDPYYLGATCDTAYPCVVEDLKELFSGDYDEAVLTGSIGWGKTFEGSIGICRILYELSCMKDPHKSFGLSSGTRIDIVVLSITQQLAMKAAFENITSKIQASEYFAKNFPYEVTKQEIRFPHKVMVIPRATNDVSALGLSVIAGIQDESNFMPKNQRNVAAEIYADMAEKIYNSLKRRIRSRFERRGKVPGILFVISSKQTSEDFTAKRIAASMDNPKIFVRDRAIWQAKPEDYFNTKTFPVLAGNEQIPSKILTEEEAQVYRGNVPEGAVLVDVPLEFKSDFETDLEGNLRDIAGIATVAIRPFIGQRNKIFEAVAMDKMRFNRLHPFTTTEWNPEASPPGKLIPERLVQMVDQRQPGGDIIKVSQPLISPGAIRHARFDLSLRQDATGFAVAHIAGFKAVQRRDRDGNPYSEQAPIIVVDMLLRIVPPVGGELLLANNRKLLYDLTQLGFSISKVTLDQFQGADTIQTLKRSGYDAELLSVDLTTEPYDELRNALYEGRLLFYEYPPLIEELKKLQRNIVGSLRKRPKIDHPPRGSKDCGDALAGVVHTLTANSSFMPMPILQDGQRAQDPWLEGSGRAMVGPVNGQNPGLGVPSVGPLPILGGGGEGDWDPEGSDGWNNW